MPHASKSGTKKWNGVGFRVHKSFANVVVNYHGYRVINIHGILSNEKQNLFDQAHMPASIHNGEDLQINYDQIQERYTIMMLL